VNSVAVPAPRNYRTLAAALIAAMLAALIFWVVAALPYLRFDPAQFGPFWARRYGLLVHIFGGSIALLVGPLQLWLGATRRRLGWHRRLGIVYVSGVAVGVLGAFYLALTTPAGRIYAWGLFSLGVAWTITTAMAYVAVRRRALDQHREWMIRSYVVTLAFVLFRALVVALGALDMGTLNERVALAAWFCWAIPLLLTEPLLQYRKLGPRGS
jgi:hypothetical protein